MAKRKKKEESGESHEDSQKKDGQSKGGKARAEKLSPEERSEIAKKAAEVRWGIDVPDATHGSPDHPLTIGEIKIPCYVLSTGQRVLHQRGMVSALGMSRGSSSNSGGDRLAKFATGKIIKPFMENSLQRVTEPIKFRTRSGNLAYGYEATVLADICEAVLKAREEGLLQKQQEHIAVQCEILMRGFARVGIIALVDEATGFQQDRARNALAEILEKFISKELTRWAKRFPDEFYTELYRLRSELNPEALQHSKKMPQYIGQLTNNVVYKRLAPGVLEELKRIVPKDKKGRRKYQYHRRLTEDIGHPKLQTHLTKVVTTMQLSEDWDDFIHKLDRIAPICRMRL